MVLRRCLPLLLVPLLGSACSRQVSASIEPEATPSPSVAAPEREQAATSSASNDFAPAAAIEDMERWLLLLDGRDTSREDPNWFQGTHGLRALYETTEALLTTTVLLPALGQRFEAPVFVSGPHTDTPNFDARQDWGHHNPEFVANVLVAARAWTQDPARVARTAEAFDNQLRDQATTYLLVYDAIHHDSVWFNDFVDGYGQLIGTEDATFSYYDELDPVSVGLERRGLSWYEADTAAYFWARRELDGTAAQWRAVLQVVLDAYGALEGLEPAPLPRSAIR